MSNRKNILDCLIGIMQISLDIHMILDAEPDHGRRDEQRSAQ